MKFGPTAILFATLFLVMVGFGIIIPILPFYSIQLGANPFHIGLLMASYSLMQFIFSPIWGSLSDKYGRKPIILLGLAGFSITFLLFGLANSLPLLFASRVLGGILSSACLPTAMAYMADTTDENERGAGMGMLGAAMGLGMVVGPSIGGLFSVWHLGMPFFFSSGLAAVNLAFAAIFLKESKKQHDRSEIKYDRFKHLLSLRGFMAFTFFLVFLLSYSLSGAESTFPLLANIKLGYGAYDMGIVFTFMGLTGVIVQGLLVGKMIRKLGEENVIKIGLLLSAVGYSLILFAFNHWTLVLFISGAVVGQGLLRPSLASLISKDTELEEGATMGAMQSVDSLGRILGPVAGGFLFQMSMSLPFLSSGGLNILALLALLFLL
ncbi:MAG: MFS transporter [Candidatus Margulisbacteria bacterium]|nr:MFS transporter [Candidatus Margulisiibacteriota bacterium]